MSSNARDISVESFVAWLKRLGLRFAALYLFIYILFDNTMTVLLIQYGTAFQRWDDTVSAVWGVLIPWLGEHLLGHRIPIMRNGNDQLFDFVEIGVILVLAMTIAFVWTCLDRSQRRERAFHEATRILVRYFLALIIFAYGFSKILPEQFPYPDPFTLMQPVGNLTPIQLMWAFMGYSRLYSLFGGIAEITGGGLLFFRRTPTLGALILAGVMTNVTVMDAAYDVAVKLIAVNVLLMALFLLLPDAQRLANAVLLYRSMPTVSLTRPWPKSWIVFANLAKAVFIGWALFSNISISARAVTGYDLARMQPMTGFYQVRDFKWNKQHVTVPHQGRLAWQRVVIETRPIPSQNHWIFFQILDALTPDGHVSRYPLEIERIDQTHGLFKITHLADERDGNIATYALSQKQGYAKSMMLRYVVVHGKAASSMDAGREEFVLDGSVDGARLSMRLTPLSTSTFVLVRSKIPIVEPDNFVWTIW